MKRASITASVQSISSSRPRDGRRRARLGALAAVAALVSGATAYAAFDGGESVIAAESVVAADAPVRAPARAPTDIETEQLKAPDVIFVPTPQPVVDKMLELVKPKKSDLVYDLGCGDGRIVVTAAKRFGTKAIGFDIDPQRVAEARENVKKNKVEHLVTIEERDIFTLDLSPANIVTLYLLPSLNVRLIPQLEKLKAGSRVVSHDFDMRGVIPKRVVRLRPKPDEREHVVYLFNVPLVREQAPQPVPGSEWPRL